MNAVLLISHGSRSSKTIDEVLALIDKLQQHLPNYLFQHAFLEIESPSIPQGIDLCVSKGAYQVIVLLNFLNSGRHVDEDIPTLIQQAKQKYPHVDFHITKPVGQHESILNLFIDLIHHAT